MFGNIPTDELITILNQIEYANLDEAFEAHDIELELESRIPQEQEDYDLEESDFSM